MAGLTDKLATATEGSFSGTSPSAMWVNGANWVISYKYSVDWFPSALVETAIVKAFTEYYHQEGKLNSKPVILKCLKAALSPFDLHQKFATDKSNTRRELGETLRVWVRAQGASNPTEITDELLKQMKYP